MLEPNSFRNQMIRIFIIFVLLGVLHCTPKKPIDTLLGLVLFKKGNLIANETPLQKGDRVAKDMTLKVQEDSFADIQIIEPKTEIVIRMKSNSELVLNSHLVEKTEQKVLVQKMGNVLYNIESKVEPKEIKFVTPTVSLGVRGTQFSISVDENSNTRLHLLSGFAVYRLYIPELEHLPPQIVSTNLDLKRKIEFLQKKEILLSQGEFIEIQASAKEELLEELGIRSLLSETNPDVWKKHLESSPLMDDQAWEDRIQKLDLSPTKMPPEEFMERLKEVVDMEPIKQSQLSTKESIDIALLNRKDPQEIEVVEEKLTPTPKKEVPPPVVNTPPKKVVVAKPVKHKKIALQPVVKETPRGHTVQVGLFSHKENAERLKSLESRFGHKVFLFPKEKGYCVQIGDFVDREDAVELKLELKKAGYTGAFVPEK